MMGAITYDSQSHYAPQKMRFMESLGKFASGIRLMESESVTQRIKKKILKEVKDNSEYLTDISNELKSIDNPDLLDTFITEGRPYFEISKQLIETLKEIEPHDNLETELKNIMIDTLTEIVNQFNIFSENKNTLFLKHVHKMSDSTLSTVWSGEDNDVFDEFYKKEFQT